MSKTLPQQPQSLDLTGPQFPHLLNGTSRGRSLGPRPPLCSCPVWLSIGLQNCLRVSSALSGATVCPDGLKRREFQQLPLPWALQKLLQGISLNSSQTSTMGRQQLKANANTSVGKWPTSLCMVSSPEPCCSLGGKLG